MPKGAHELWTELKESLIKRPVLQGRYRSRFFVQAAHETTYESKVWIFKKLLHYEHTSCQLTVSSHCKNMLECIVCSPILILMTGNGQYTRDAFVMK